ncbi:hypothetical protein NQD34_013509 [Periophthalmus magnuspinnatus]|uniref:uncharacterized protein LOC117385924 n=1 Tax=Periophthalmus magnuspinnatus TaxID=409849 RepID=UPI0022BC9B21|nr:uncharacterized protein LOC117385924 [Periophthalmus magnuspinnatus]XP_055084839.1 uncharacterized protein LOC117385924 [Periophthalmus magnuspinnatus]KAJ0006236.1 hypothetical protein NQD34_013509 [Periophthalmus magnuspinnatus]
MTLIWPLSWLMPLLHFSYGGNGEFVQTLVGERLTLITPKRFQSANSCLLVKVYPRESPQSGRVPVAELTKSQWNPVPDYKDRLTPGDGVEFKEATYNDNGNYEITCNNIRKIIIQVEVLVPHELRVSAGDSVKLPCYFNTKARSVEGVRWEQGQELVMENYFTSNELNSGENSKER